MEMKERLKVHKQIEEENARKQDLWERFNYAEKQLGFRPSNEIELRTFECNGYDDIIYMYR